MFEQSRWVKLFAKGLLYISAYGYLRFHTESYCLAVDAAIKSGKLNPKNNYSTSNIHLADGDGWIPAYFTVCIEMVRVVMDKRYWMKWYASKWTNSTG
ncbi:hypothetical protein Hanom_Chr11g00972661 [Helianthus anomalus]